MTDFKTITATSLLALSMIYMNTSSSVMAATETSSSSNIQILENAIRKELNLPTDHALTLNDYHKLSTLRVFNSDTEDKIGLTSIPKELMDACNLKRLYLNPNNLSEIPEGFSISFPHLEFLSIGTNPQNSKTQNRISKIPDDIFELPQLVHLGVAYQNIGPTLPDSMEKAPSLRELNLRGTKIEATTGALDKMMKSGQIILVDLAGTPLGNSLLASPENYNTFKSLYPYTTFKIGLQDGEIFQY